MPGSEMRGRLPAPRSTEAMPCPLCIHEIHALKETVASSTFLQQLTFQFVRGMLCIPARTQRCDFLLQRYLCSKFCLQRRQHCVVVFPRSCHFAECWLLRHFTQCTRGLVGCIALVHAMTGRGWRGAPFEICRLQGHRGAGTAREGRRRIVLRLRHAHRKSERNCFGQRGTAAPQLAQGWQCRKWWHGQPLRRPLRRLRLC
mmetsp:Transcript_31450/g.83790  ORF Transcript_31450/g.83790 Transcript_31450/m.83790 type:complete len:201 (+) Transcript_31450:394-996(+)